MASSNAWPECSRSDGGVINGGVIVITSRANVFLSVVLAMSGLTAFGQTSPYAAWKNGPSPAADYFPIAVWLQAPANAAKYHAIGINTYVGLWRGPTEAQLAQLEKNGISVFCGFNPKLVDSKTAVGWMHGDEPDNAQALPRGQRGYGPPILPEKIETDYRKITEADPTRPVMLNLGQGVAYDNYIGRGVRRGKLEDYPKYIKGCDIVSFDIYPAVHDAPEIAGKLEFVARGVSRLREWSADKNVVWNCIETTHISNEKTKPTPAQVRAEVWMSLIHGSRGLIYFAHEFKPKFVEAGLLADGEMAKAVGAINAQVRELAPALNAPAEPLAADAVTSSNADVPVACTVRQAGGKRHVFAVAMRDGETRVTFRVPGITGDVEVIGEGRSLAAKDGAFEDAFKGYEVHLYRVAR
jgi:hypothetical protein